jgi:hypothetical protein
VAPVVLIPKIRIGKHTTRYTAHHHPSLLLHESATPFSHPSPIFHVWFVLLVLPNHCQCEFQAIFGVGIWAMPPGLLLLLRVGKSHHTNCLDISRSPLSHPFLSCSARTHIARAAYHVKFLPAKESMAAETNPTPYYDAHRESVRFRFFDSGTSLAALEDIREVFP